MQLVCAVDEDIEREHGDVAEECQRFISETFHEYASGESIG